MRKIIIKRGIEDLDIPMISEFLRNAYWSIGRTEEQVRHSIQNSICFGVYIDENQIGFARVITDKTIFAYVMDVFVLPEFRGNGYSINLMKYILKESDLLHVEKWFLATKDAHDLYRKFGFLPIKHPDKLLERGSKTEFLNI